MIKNLFPTILAVSMIIFAGCQEDNENSAVTETPGLSFVSVNTIEVPAEGGTYKVEYKVDNPSEDGVFFYECQADWITDIKTGQSLMTFSVSPNTLEESRESRITIIYDYITGKDSLTVSVSQAGIEPESEPEKFSVTMTVDNTEWNSAVITVVPNDPEAIYFFDYCTKEEYESFGSDEEIFLYLTDQLFLYAGSTQDAIYEYGISGEYTSTLGHLDELTEYVCYAFKVDLDLQDQFELLSEVFEISFSTPKQELTEFSIDLTLELKGTNLDLTAAPSDDTPYYYMNVVSTWELNILYSGDIQAYVTDKVTLYLDYGMAAHVKDVPGVFQGRHTECYQELTSGDEYLAIAVGVDEEGYPNSKIVSEKFTPEAIISDATVTYHVKCFDGTEVATKYPDQYGDAMGRTLVVFEKKFSENTAGYKYSIYDGDYGYLTGDAITSELIDWGDEGDMTEERETRVYSYDATFTVLLVAYDKDHNYGVPSATVYTFSKDDALPIEEFIP